jgi:hypothetical protein
MYSILGRCLVPGLALEQFLNPVRVSDVQGKGVRPGWTQEFPLRGGRSLLGSYVQGPWCGSNVLGTVLRHVRRPSEESGESTVCWVVSVPAPVAEGTWG